jgi:hypothetical protein
MMAPGAVAIQVMNIFSGLLRKSAIALLCFAVFILPIRPILAAKASPAYNKISSHTINAFADHEIVFRAPSGIDEATDTVTIDLPHFIFGSVGISDIDLHYGSSTGFENATSIAAAPGVDIWGASIAGTTITLTAPTNAASGTVNPYAYVAVRIGTNAVGGTNQLQNPATAMQARVLIGGTFGDENDFYIPIVNNDAMAVSAFVSTTTVPQPPGGGGGGGGVINPPVISNIQVINITSNSARITWDTDKPADSVVAYGFTVAHASGTVSDASYVTSHSIDIVGLDSLTTYHFSVKSTDAALLSAESGDLTFTTLGDGAPPVISNVQAINITDTTAIIIWNTNEPANSLVDYGLTSGYGSAQSSAGYVTSHAIQLTGLTEGTTYHFRVTSVDPANNSAVSTDYIFTTTIDTTAPANVTLTATPGDTVVYLNWTLPSDPDLAGVRIVVKTGGYPTGPNDGTVVYEGLATSTTNTGLTNGVTYYYAAYAYDTHTNYASGALASATPVGTFVLPPTPTTTTSTPPIPPTPTTTPPVVTPTTTPPVVLPPTTTTTPPVISPTTTVPGAVAITANYYNANGTIELPADSGGNVGVLSGATVLVVVPVIGLGNMPSQVTVTVGNAIYSLQPNSDGSAYSGTFVAPAPGVYPSIVTVVFQNGTVGQANYSIVSQNGGQVVEDGVTGPTTQAVEGAVIQLYQEQNGVWVPFGSPQQSGTDGGFGYVVPNGRYYAEVEREGYRKRVTNPVYIGQNVYRERISLIPLPKEIVLEPGAPIVEQIAAITGNAAEQVAYGVKVVREAFSSPAIQEANAIAAPAVLAVTLLNTASALSFFNLLAYLQYLFTQPLLLFGRRRKKKWGTVFNSLTKQPIDLAIVRLVHFETKLVVQTTVTDKLGRFRFLVQKGNFLIEVVKPGYVFPTQYLAEKKEDVDYLDLYHGDKIEAPEDQVVAVNIPLDPVTSEETPKKVLLKKTARLAKHALAFSGIPFGMIILVITPSAPHGLLLLAQIGVYILFRRLAMPAKPKSWGISVDGKTKKPLSNVVVRIFDKKFNKLLETQVTDRNGKYGFFVRRNVYYITAEKAGYSKYVSPDIDLSQKDDAVIDQNIVLMPVDR